MRDVEKGCQQNKVVYLKSQTDVIKEIVESKSIDEFINGWDAIQAFDYTYIFEGSKKKALNKQDINKLFKQIATMINNYGDELKNGLLADDFNRKCTQITSAFKNAIYAKLKKREDEKKEFKAKKKSTSEDEYDDLVKQITSNPSVCRLFPYIDFEYNSPVGTVLLATIDKLMLGFYDIEGNKNITHLEDHVIFMDEFDFLPDSIIKAMNRAKKIENSLSFIKQFCDKVEKFRIDNEVTQDAKEIINTLKEEMTQLSIDFPGEHILTIDKQFFNACKQDAWGYIFDCGYRVLSGNFYIKNGDGCLVLTGDSQSSIYQFMRIIKQTEQKILYFLNN
ncbi:hypothetical protein BGP_2105 [Beggiatoa sp. PS]|nr:hypothetical protein BGP_2105 [Beggiatoa sp. PS]